MIDIVFILNEIDNLMYYPILIIVMAMADITMGGMTLINLPTCMLLGKIAIDCLRDYEKQKKLGKDPVFKAASLGLEDEEVDFWK